MFIVTVLLWLSLVFIPDAPPDGWKQLASGMDYQNIIAKTPAQQVIQRLH